MRRSSVAHQDDDDEADDEGTSRDTKKSGSRPSWRWGELPTTPPRPSQNNQNNQNSNSSTSTSNNDKKEDQEAEQGQNQDQENQQSNGQIYRKISVPTNPNSEHERSMLSGMFSFMKKTKRIRHNPESEGIYLSDLTADELDPEVAALYFPSAYRENANNPSKSSQDFGNFLYYFLNLSKNTYILRIEFEYFFIFFILDKIQEKDDDIESGNGTSLPQSPHSVEGAIGDPKSLDSDFDESKVTSYEPK